MPAMVAAVPIMARAVTRSPRSSIPRSPTTTSCSTPNRSRTRRTGGTNVGGSPVFALEHRDRHRAAAGVRQQPVVDLQLAPLAIAIVPNAANGQVGDARPASLPLAVMIFL